MANMKYFEENDTTTLTLSIKLNLVITESGYLIKKKGEAMERVKLIIYLLIYLPIFIYFIF